MKTTLMKSAIWKVMALAAALCWDGHSALRAAGSEPPTIAVAPVHGDSTAGAMFEKAGCGEEMAQIFITELGRLTTFRVLENIDLQALKDEMKLGDDGWIEPKEKTEKGHFKAADYIFIVRVTRFGATEKEWGGSSFVPIPRNLPFMDRLTTVVVKQSENEVQLDWRVVDAKTRVAVKTGRGVGKEKGTAFDLASVRGSGFMREEQFKSSAIGKAMMKAVTAVVDELRSFQPPTHAVTPFSPAAPQVSGTVASHSATGQVLYAKESTLYVSLGTQHGIKNGDRLQLFRLEEIKNDAGAVVFTKKVQVGEIEIVDASTDRSEATYRGETPAREGWIVRQIAAK